MDLAMKSAEIPGTYEPFAGDAADGGGHFWSSKGLGGREVSSSSTEVEFWGDGEDFGGNAARRSSFCLRSTRKDSKGGAGSSCGIGHYGGRLEHSRRKGVEA